MKNPDFPHNEQGRLATLRSLNVLDTSSEERFDRLTRLAKRLFGVPIALVSLIDDDRQWFKSSIGLAVTETSRYISFCGHTILDDGVFVVSNALEDERFSDNPLVLDDPNIRFYAGCPLAAPNGDKMGTLCVIDHHPRNFKEDDIEALKDLAAMVERELGAVLMATLDELTNIANRRAFITVGQHFLDLCVTKKLAVSLVFIDLDKLKLINDTYGHREGDKVLLKFVEKIRVVCRDTDIFARMGGDEFAILLMSTTLAQADLVMARLQEQLDDYNKSSDSAYDISFSFGSAEFSVDKHGTIDKLIAEGDFNMYALKKLKYGTS